MHIPQCKNTLLLNIANHYLSLHRVICSLLVEGLASMLIAAEVTEGCGRCGIFLKQNNNEVCHID